MTDLPQEDEPLDPKVEAIRRKMVRLLAVSGGIMMIGLMTVLAAIVYRVNRADPDEAAAAAASVNAPLPPQSAIALPAGSEILHTAFEGNRIMLTVREASGSRTILIYEANGGLLSRIDLR
ncbi:DUF6476 family protein [Pseudahrensia aquimaris]|uniref:DUF6476 family protein n=1 Tax=Pseudahrensia aquimaris TaxID=744461 RepID=A0ABW3FA46_9HYPH